MVQRESIKRAGAASLGALLAVLLAACGVGEASTAGEAMAADAAPLPVDVVRPVRGEIRATYPTTATLDADRDAPVVARVAGEVVEILVEEGDRVAKGQVLARLDGERLRLELMQAQANLDGMAREYARMASLHERGLVSSASFERMQFDLDSLRATYDLKRLDYGYTSIRAPLSGVITARDIKLGQQLDVNGAAFRVTDTSELVAHLRIPQGELSRFAPGHEAELRVDAMPEDVFAVRIERISPTIDRQNGTFRATAIVDNQGGLLAPGMFGRFEIAYEKRVDALTIPAAAVVEEDKDFVVYVVADGAAARRAVTIGIEDDGRVEVLAGLDEDDQVVVTGQRSLRDGSRVLASRRTGAPVTG